MPTSNENLAGDSDTEPFWHHPTRHFAKHDWPSRRLLNQIAKPQLVFAKSSGHQVACVVWNLGKKIVQYPLQTPDSFRRRTAPEAGPECTQLPAGRSPSLCMPTETQCVPPVLQGHEKMPKKNKKRTTKRSQKKNSPGFHPAQSGAKPVQWRVFIAR